MKFRTLIQISALAFLTTAWAGAHAQSADKWHKECSSCHIAYPAKALPAASWKKIMSELDQHFGVDASLSPQDNQEIASYLEKNAGKRLPSGEQPTRITQSHWFKSRHEEISAAVWKRPAVKSAANCGACHKGADAGDFDEDHVHIPK